MVDSRCQFQFRVLFVISALVSIVHGNQRCPGPLNKEHGTKFEQKASRFWEFKEGANRWEEISLPFDLVSCINGTCSKVGSIERTNKQSDQSPEANESKRIRYRDDVSEEINPDRFLPLRKRISVTKMSESSIWVTGQSGSIYERFWNGVQWVIAPHELPLSAGRATSVFIVNQTVLALSEAGGLYELQLNENSQPIWTEIELSLEPSTEKPDTELRTVVQMKSGIVSNDGEKLYLSSRSGVLFEISELEPLRWTNHGRPPGAYVTIIADGSIIKPGVVFTISSTGELYEHDKNSKPSWKRHIWSKASAEQVQLATSKGCFLYGWMGAQSQSLFLLTKNGSLMERRLYQRKWKWVGHGAPQGNILSAITTTEQSELSENIVSMFFTTSTGSIFEYQPPRSSGFGQDNHHKPEPWVNHQHPEHAKVARGIPGVQLQLGRIVFPLDDGRLGELHLSGIGGEDLGPTPQVNVRRKSVHAYEWSVLGAPESEGWNAEYCTDRNGPSNCIAGTKDVAGDDELDYSSTSASTRRRRTQGHQHYLPVHGNGDRVPEPPDEKQIPTSSATSNFRMQAMHAERSFFLVTASGLILEYQNDWSTPYGNGIWLRHEYTKPMKSALARYNGSIYLVDKDGNLVVRERAGNELSWINCTSKKKGWQVETGAPWDGIPGRDLRFTAEDALFFVSKRGRLLQLTVALRKFRWKDCNSPPNTKIAFIVDHETLRMNIVFVIGKNGRLYQYNRVTELWHEHYKSPHLILSLNPGVAMRPSQLSLTGSLFMILENGGLVEYHWQSTKGWSWVEHGTPMWDVRLVAAPGPCFEDGQLFVIGSDGHAYRRYLDEGAWRWESHEHPHMGQYHAYTDDTDDEHDLEDSGGRSRTNSDCNVKVAAVRPIPFSEHSVIFELQDGRLAELRRSEVGAEWEWTRIIGTPTSPCPTDYWTALAT